jgi:hypothetical protein
MIKDQSLNFLWRFDPTHDDAAHQVFTHVWYDGYCSPGGFYWDSGDPPVTDANIKKVADNLANNVKGWLSGYKTQTDVLFPFGCDFQFQQASVR